jgi:hypothetical protein
MNDVDWDEFKDGFKALLKHGAGILIGFFVGVEYAPILGIASWFLFWLLIVITSKLSD